MPTPSTTTIHKVHAYAWHNGDKNSSLHGVNCASGLHNETPTVYNVDDATGECRISERVVASDVRRKHRVRQR
jgi:hypothetical protein